MKEIPLTRGFVAIVDDEDYEYLSQWKWCALMVGRGDRKKPYAVRGTLDANGKARTFMMHRVITGAGAGEIVDHADRCGIHNWRENLRVTTQAKNSFNRPGNQTGKKTSLYKGVYWQKDIGRWRALFRGKYLGTFVNEISAAAAYDVAAFAYDPEFSHLNLNGGGLSPVCSKQ